MKLRHIFFSLAIGMVAFAADPTPKAKAPANRLAQESSPYLLQHAHNPVDWYPWGEEAFAKAKKDGKFIFLSIGYSSCHWCHVMERETFENKDVAKIINENFVCIKVDREERPDVDDIYMTALHVTGQNGGWPLSMFLTSEGKPIFGGTYFPPEDKKISDEDTIPGFKSILKKVIELKKDKSKELHEQADHVAKLTAEELDRSAGFLPIGKMDASWASDAVNQYELDPTHGGLGSKRREFAGTKFPRVSALLLLQSQSVKPGQENLAKLFTLTMEKMNEGGIYDHLGGGFHRYSTERTWTVPHFEKMLYDNAQLVELYAKEYARKPREDYRRVIDETLVWMAREMTAPEGYFYSALDADSEGEEGKFYVWEAKELDALLGTGADAKLFRDVYSLNKVNFEDKYYILRLPKSWAELAKTHKLTETELVAKLEPLKKKLLEVRSKRHRPFLDTKLITSWNGQMIAAYALAGQVLKEKRYTEAGEKAAEFILKTLKDKEGRLLRIYAGKPGEKPTARVRAFLDDYAFLIHGLLALHDATGNKRWLDESVRLQKELQSNFGDDKRGGYFNTPNDGEKLFARGKDSYDGAQPSGNGIAVRNSVRLWVKTQDEAYRANAQKSLRSTSPAMKTAPTSVPVALDTLDQFIALKGLKDEPAATTEFKAPEKPIDSTDVVKVEAKLTGTADGIDTYTVNIEIAKGWHIYANKVDNKTLLESSTVVELLVNGKIDPLAEVVYPAGSVIEDAKAGNYKVYDGKATIRISVKHEDKAKVAFQVKLVACNDKVCLKPSTIKAEIK